MTATNHALTGAVIGLLVGQPVIALPAAFLSHYLCDALPHYGSDAPNDNRIGSGAFVRYLYADGLLCVTLVLVLAATMPRHWLLAAVCAFLATSPDLFWINRFRIVRAGKPWKPNLHSKFAAAIQWFERPIGGLFEAAWAIAAISIIASFVA